MKQLYRKLRRDGGFQKETPAQEYTWSLAEEVTRERDTGVGAFITRWVHRCPCLQAPKASCWVRGLQPGGLRHSGPQPLGPAPQLG